MSGRAALAFGKSSRPVIPGMLMSERIRINDAASLISLSALSAELRKIHRKPAVADVASELLAKQRLNIGFVANLELDPSPTSARPLSVSALICRIETDRMDSPRIGDWRRRCSLTVPAPSRPSSQSRWVPRRPGVGA